MTFIPTSMDPRFPIGRFSFPGSLDDRGRDNAIAAIAEAPARMRQAVRALDEEQIDTAYRPGGWTVRQVIHHVPDSHMNAYVRFKLALTESEPLVKGYDERLWAELPDLATTPIETSLQLLEALHVRWVHLLRHLGAGEFERTLRHPQHGVVRLDQLLALYAWHGRHHVAHISQLRERMGWR